VKLVVKKIHKTYLMKKRSPPWISSATPLFHFHSPKSQAKEAQLHLALNTSTIMSIGLVNEINLTCRRCGL
jgi:hypothetical protein